MSDLAGLQTELKAAKEKYTDYLKLGKAKKEVETFPFPVWVSLEIERPPNAKAIDMETLTVKLVVDSLEKGNVHVEFGEKEIPDQLREKMCEEVLKTWNKYIGKKAAPWGIAPTLEWVATNYAKMLMMDPACVHPYEGVDMTTDMSMKRYAIGPPVVVVEEESEEEESEEEETETQYLMRMQALMGDIEVENKKKGLSPEEIEQKKKEAAEMGEKHRQLSKKELEEQQKGNKGKRQAKTGQAHRKFDGEGATSKEDKKKKQATNISKRFGI